MRASEALLADAAIGVTAGLVATSLTGPVQKLLYRFTPDAVKRREEQARPGPPTQIAAKKLARAVNAEPDEQQTEQVATVIHYGSGIPWGAVYPFLRRHSGMTPLGAALATGATMALVLDEALTPAMGFSAPNRDYPALTHVRGFLAHLAFGAAAAATAEALYRLTDTTPARAGTERYARC